jgi:hypothetical protein
VGDDEQEVADVHQLDARLHQSIVLRSNREMITEHLCRVLLLQKDSTIANAGRYCLYKTRAAPIAVNKLCVHGMHAPRKHTLLAYGTLRAGAGNSASSNRAWIAKHMRE